MNDLFSNSMVTAAIYFTDQGHYIFKHKKNEGKIISKNLRAPEVASAFTLETMDSGWINPGIQRTGFDTQGPWFVFYMPPCRNELKLYKTDTFYSVPIPATLLIGAKKTLYLFALDGQVFDPKGKVYTAPFPNIHPDGKICWGQNKAPEVNAAKSLEVWKLFFLSPFNGDLASGKSKKFPQDVREQLKSLAGKKAYPANLMKVCFASVEDLINRMILRAS